LWKIAGKANPTADITKKEKLGESRVIARAQEGHTSQSVNFQSLAMLAIPAISSASVNPQGTFESEDLRNLHSGRKNIGRRSLKVMRSREKGLQPLPV
jgi:hypothetical protein